MPFDISKMNGNAKVRDAGGAYLNIAITITPIVAALKKIEEKAGVDLSEEIKKLEDLNASSFARFTEITGWVNDV
ncbi:hypothetical protein U1707_10295 [Sphingomonas sp. PB2P12]|uniref:hypothetical protein n=1 Tax=Sphingomonas sandaracina TaxID=3096157 RepID=UPI002FC9179E